MARDSFPSILPERHCSSCLHWAPMHLDVMCLCIPKNWPGQMWNQSLCNKGKKRTKKTVNIKTNQESQVPETLAQPSCLGLRFVPSCVLCSISLVTSQSLHVVCAPFHWRDFTGYSLVGTGIALLTAPFLFSRAVPASETDSGCIPWWSHFPLHRDRLFSTLNTFPAVGESCSSKLKVGNASQLFLTAKAS